MGNVVPSVLLYGQALKLLEELQLAQEQNLVKDAETILSELTDILIRFEESAGKPLVNYEPIAETEPPLSEKANRFWTAAEKDVNLLQQQVDMLRAASIVTHNTLVTNTRAAFQDNARLNNKLKTLQLYSNNSDSSIITFGDSFKSLDSVDNDLIPDSEEVFLAHEGFVTLGRRGQLVDLSPDAAIKILGTSNGFLGNNQEITDPSDTATDPESGYVHYTFKAESNDYSSLSNITDGEPNTWIEYEHYEVPKAARLAAGNYNFEYLDDSDSEAVKRVDWAKGPTNGVLKLGLEFDLGKIDNINVIDLTPFGLEGNANYPVLVRQIQTSPNGTDWTSVFPTKVWIGTEVNVRAARSAENVLANRAVWTFESRAVRYVRVYIEQPNPVNSNIGHPFWVNEETEAREEGPIPPVDNPQEYWGTDVRGDLVQFREYFEGKRWAIGIRDVALQQVRYVEKSTLITRPLRAGGVIDRVVLEDADIVVPADYDTSQSWVRFFISPDDGETWLPISRIEDNFNGVPEQISFNDPLPASLREPNVYNHDTDSPVTSVRLKVELLRPQDSSSTTPILRFYKLKVKRL